VLAEPVSSRQRIRAWLATTANLNQTASLAVSFLLASFAQTQKTQPSAGLETLTDKKSGLEFVRIPKGQYPELLSLSEKQLEKTQTRKVKVGPIWVGMTDVTVAAYEKCAKGKACSMDPASRDGRAIVVVVPAAGAVNRGWWCRRP
jgi:formylglycine-generating enzyme required for sulfatase activity